MKKSLLLTALLGLTFISCNKEEMRTVTTDSQNSALNAAKEIKAEPEAKTFNAICPISGEKVDPSAPTVEYKGKKIGFCCGGCIDKFKADPEKALSHLSPDGQKWVSSEKGEM